MGGSFLLVACWLLRACYWTGAPTCLLARCLCSRSPQYAPKLCVCTHDALPCNALPIPTLRQVLEIPEILRILEILEILAIPEILEIPEILDLFGVLVFWVIPEVPEIPEILLILVIPEFPRFWR